MDAIAKQSKDVQLQLLAMDSENKKLSSKLQPSDLRIRQTQVWKKKILFKNWGKYKYIIRFIDFIYNYKYSK